MDIPQDMKPDPQGILPAAYIGVSGNRYRIRVPVKQIEIEPLEGRLDEQERLTFKSWHDASWFLATRAKEITYEGIYEKFAFDVTWANGAKYCGRYDLYNKNHWPEIETQVRNFLTFLVNEEPCTLNETDLISANYMLEALDMGQPHPSPAPDDWPVLRDYRDGAPEPGTPRLENELYAAFA
jgi:hypothetical protein